MYSCMKCLNCLVCVFIGVGSSFKNILTALIMLVVIVVSIGVLVVYCRRRHAARNLGYTTTVAVPQGPPPAPVGKQS